MKKLSQRENASLWIGFQSELSFEIENNLMMNWSWNVYEMFVNRQTNERESEPVSIINLQTLTTIE